MSILGALNVVTMIGPRIYYAMARDGVFFKRLTYVHPNFGTPTSAIILQAIWACLLILTGTFGTFFTYVSVMITLFSAFTVGSVIVLRCKRPELKRPYKLWGYPIVPILFVAREFVDRVGIGRGKSKGFLDWSRSSFASAFPLT